MIKKELNQHFELNIESDIVQYTKIVTCAWVRIYTYSDGCPIPLEVLSCWILCPKTRD